MRRFTPFPRLSFLGASLLLAAPLLAQSDDLDPRRTPIVRVVEQARPAVVSIRTNRPERRWTFFGYQETVQESSGTGVLVYESGYIVTNNHVVRDATRILVSFDRADDERIYEAKLVSKEESEDLALLKIDAPGPFPVIPMADDDPIIAETVIAIGNAYGNSHTVSTGIISGLHRDIRAGGLNFTDLIQTDAAINPGNSGGPLVNVLGELVGINTAVTGAAENIGFAIPVARVRYVLSKKLLALDNSRSWLGFDVDDELRVNRIVPGGPADEAGLVIGDRLREINGEPVEDDESYKLARLAIQPEDPARLALERGADRLSLVLRAINRVDGIIFDRLGVFTERIRLGFLGGNYLALQITQVHPEGAAAEVGIRPGDVIAAVAPKRPGLRPKRPRQVEELAWFLSSLETGDAIAIEVWRDDDGDGDYERKEGYSELYEGIVTLH